jgi:lipopolysaccharide export system protein LptC
MSNKQFYITLTVSVLAIIIICLFAYIVSVEDDKSNNTNPVYEGSEWTVYKINDSTLLSVPTGSYDYNKTKPFVMKTK